MKMNKISIADLTQRSAGLVTTAELVAKHHVSPSAISNLANKYGFPKLTRGRKKAAAPSPQQLEILSAIRSETLEKVGLRYGVTKQRVWYISKRWAHYQLLDESSVVEVNAERSMPEEVLATKKDVRPFVISFRLTTAQMNRLRGCTAGNFSANKTARQLLDKALGFVALTT